MNSSEIQIKLFTHLKSQLPSHKSMVDEVAELLNISNDSAYRRIRGEKPIDLGEIYKLCQHFHISLDQLLSIQSEAIIFSGKLNNYAKSNLGEWLNDLQQQLLLINSFENRHIYFIIKDIPPFYFFQIPELASFKFFFWMKSILQDEDFRRVKFKLDDDRFQDFYITCKKTAELYNQVPTTEIWNVESLNSTLRQIEFYRDAGCFTQPEDIKLLYLKVKELINHIERQAELGVKFILGQQPKVNSPSYRLFINELILGDNTFLAELGNTRLTFLNHSVLYFVGTRDENFNNSMFNNIDNLMQKSTLISKVGEKERSNFFNNLHQNIQSRMELSK